MFVRMLAAWVPKVNYIENMSILHRIRWGRVTLTGAAVLALFSWLGGSETSSPLEADGDVAVMKPGDGLALLANRPWMDHMPRNDRDMVTQLVFLDKNNAKTGALMRTSKWRQFREGTRWAARKNGLLIQLPQLDKTIPLSAKAYSCRAPKPFDLCLELSLFGRGVKLYSKKSWTIDDLDAVDDVLVVDPDAVGQDADFLFQLADETDNP